MPRRMELDKLMEIAKQATKDTNNDGKPTYGASPVGRLMRLNISPPLTGQNR